MQPMKFFKDKFYIELVLASILFLIALSLDMLMDFIIYMLYFIIFLEIVRAVVNFIREQRVVLAIIVDAFIVITSYSIHYTKLYDICFGILFGEENSCFV